MSRETSQMNEARRYLIVMTVALIAVSSAVGAQQAPNQTIKSTEIVISNAGGTIAGHVTDARSMPITNYSVIVFATDRTKWFANSRFLKFGRPAQDGGFEITGLSPGEYWVAAVETIQGTQGNGDWEKPDVLEVLATRATRVVLAERERKLTVLRLIRR